MDDDDESMRQVLRANPLQPQDDAFTRRVLGALPPRAREFAASRRSFADAGRFGLALALLAVAQHWYSTGPGGIEAMVAVFLFLFLAFVATALVCGPLIPRSFLRLMWRGGRNWR
jgi:hypothetical protein